MLYAFRVIRLLLCYLTIRQRGVDVTNIVSWQGGDGGFL